MFQLFCLELLSAVSFLSFIVKGRIFLLIICHEVVHSVSPVREPKKKCFLVCYLDGY